MVDPTEDVVRMAPKELKTVGDVFGFLAETPEPDDPPQVQAEKAERNQKLWAELQERELQAEIHEAEHASRVQARLERQAVQEWEKERESGRLLRSAAWVVLLAGLMYVPGILAGGGLQMSWDFMVVVGAWCLFGVVGAMEFFGGGLLALVVLVALPYWLLGPIPYLIQDWFWGAATRPIPPPVEAAWHAPKVQSSKSNADVKAKAKALMEEELNEHRKLIWRRDFGDLRQRSWDIELDVQASDSADTTKSQSK